MSDRMRWRYGDTNPVVAAVESATAIEIGDLVYHDSDDVKPAAAQADQGTAAANQAAFAAKFLGVAMQRSRPGDTAAVRVAATGVFEFACAADTFELGELVGACENSAGDALENQQVVKVTDAAHAIGRIARREPAASTAVLVAIVSTVMHGGVAGTTAAAE